MIPNIDITSKEHEGYDVDRAEWLFNAGTYTARKLSLMKQENIRYLLGQSSFEEVGRIFGRYCGYCFRYMTERGGCYLCPLKRKLGEQCYKLKSYGLISHCKLPGTELIAAHKRWCKALGFVTVYKK